MDQQTFKRATKGRENICFNKPLDLKPSQLEKKVFCLNEICTDENSTQEYQISPVYRSSKMSSSFAKFCESNFSSSQTRKNSEEVISGVRSPATEFKIETISSPEAKKTVCMGTSFSPVCVYCRNCKRQVSSEIEFFQDSGSNFLSRFVKGLMMCCGKPEWLNKIVVHKCPYCSLPFISDILKK